MVKLAKYGLLFVFILLAVIIGFLLTLDVNHYKAELIQVVKDKTGREFQINGDLKLALSLIPTIAVNEVSFGNAGWGSQPDMLTANRFEAEIALIPLLQGDVRINRLVLVKPDLFLETNAEGIGNWALELAGTEGTDKEQAAPAAPGTPGFDVREISVEDARLNYKNGRSGETISMDFPMLTLRSDTTDGPVSANLETIYKGQAISMTATIGPLPQLLDDKPYPVDMKATTAGVEVSAIGTIARITQLAGLELNITVKTDNLTNLSKLSGIELPAVGPINVSGTLLDAEQSYRLQSMQAAIADYKITGNLEVALAGDRPLLTAELATPLIDIRPSTRAGEQQKKKRVFSGDPLPMDGLKAIDADLKISIKQLLTTSVELADVNLTLRINNGQLKLNPFKANIAGGNLTANVELTPKGKELELKSDINIKQLTPGLLPKLKEKHLIDDGKTDITFKGTGKGKSVAEIMAGFNGNLLVTVGKGVLQNSSLDLAGADLMSQTLSMVNPLAKEDKTTQLQCAVVRFDIKDGIAATEKGIAMETSKMTVVGGGIINLKTEELDLGVRPHPRQGIGVGAGQLAEIVRLGGTLAEPKAKTDTVAAMKTAAKVGAAVATGGLSILAGGLFDRTTADEHPCDTALGKNPTSQASATTSTTQSGAQTTEKKPNIIESTGEKVKGVFKGLFGK